MDISAKELVREANDRIDQYIYVYQTAVHDPFIKEVQQKEEDQEVTAALD